ncbi:MBL fold metallo-hydrolase [Aliihoeflea aestuarii]|jgi:phosphoribosyl 1,2-cyclic phosphate phosphodiesterase|uniref:MBL fold metallo-hydrolase n=1 Tax=Aliihoeflea aestuarii TaxID=453840 RepID=UPI0020929475|nr:MBL fold metallo-hydrolase [Aliihoeflea aestuarii]MCO6390395.1 MBL fold metallo-hydrolase [Aliihoeflea aestuarii]
MTAYYRLTILGCGSSPGVPRITGDWGNCDPANPRNRRTRTAAMVERFGPRGVTRVAIDTGPDFRQQMLAAGVDALDAVVYTHAHADHIHGIDDLRSFVLIQRRRMDIYADRTTLERLQESFAYCFETPAGSSYPPILTPHTIAHREPFSIEGDGGPIEFRPLPQFHGDTVSLGFRIGQLAYCSDVSDFPDTTIEDLADVEVLIIDALQYKHHPSHFSLEQALDWIARLKVARAILTHMHIPLDYDRVNDATPDHVEPAYDGLAIDFR